MPVSICSDSIELRYGLRNLFQNTLEIIKLSFFMKRSRIVMISRRFWPLVGGAERAMAGLASQFHSEGHSVRFLTAQWESNWPSELVHREVPVTRLNHPQD